MSASFCKYFFFGRQKASAGSYRMSSCMLARDMAVVLSIVSLSTSQAYPGELKGPSKGYIRLWTNLNENKENIIPVKNPNRKGVGIQRGKSM